jgi:hypothetical protein
MNAPDQERLLDAVNAFFADPEITDDRVSAHEIAQRAQVAPDRAVGLLFELAASKHLEFTRAEDLDPDQSFVHRPEA